MNFSVVHMKCDHVPVELTDLLKDKRYTCPACRRLYSLRRIARTEVSFHDSVGYYGYTTIILATLPSSQSTIPQKSNNSGSIFYDELNNYLFVAVRDS